MKCILLSVGVFLLILQPSAEASEVSDNRDIRFTPHITAEAWTHNQWGVSLQRSVGSNLNTDFLLSSLSLALTDRFEIGTSPVFYFLETHIINVSAKYNFWRAKHFLWSLGLNVSNFNIEDENGEILEEQLDLVSLQLLMNYIPSWTDFKFGVNLNFVEASISNLQNVDEDTLILGAEWEFGVDISKPIKEQFEITLGLGWLRESGITALEAVEFGFGLSVRMYRPNKFISTPTLGLHYSPDSEDFAFLISTSFY
jgi:hypothetical protein